MSDISARASAVRIHEEDAQKFESWYQTSGFASAFTCGRTTLQPFFEKSLDMLAPGARILDVGCGVGQQALQLHSRGFDVQGVDPAESMISLANQKLSDRICLGSILDLPFESNSFDMVYSLEVFRYLDAEDNAKGLKEILRVLRPGGVFFGTFVNRLAFDGFYLLESTRRVLRRSRCHHEFDTPWGLEKKLRSVDFVQVETHGSMFAWLRILYKINEQLGSSAANLFAPVEKLNDWRLLRPFSGHLMALARKRMG